MSEFGFNLDSFLVPKRYFFKSINTFFQENLFENWIFEQGKYKIVSKLKLQFEPTNMDHIFYVFFCTYILIQYQNILKTTRGFLSARLILNNLKINQHIDFPLYIYIYIVTYANNIFPFLI